MIVATGQLPSLEPTCGPNCDLTLAALMVALKWKKILHKCCRLGGRQKTKESKVATQPVPDSVATVDRSCHITSALLCPRPWGRNQHSYIIHADFGVPKEGMKKIWLSETDRVLLVVKHCHAALPCPALTPNKQLQNTINNSHKYSRGGNTSNKITIALLRGPRGGKMAKPCPLGVRNDRNQLTWLDTPCRPRCRHMETKSKKRSSSCPHGEPNVDKMASDYITPSFGCPHWAGKELGYISFAFLTFP